MARRKKTDNERFTEKLQIMLSYEQYMILELLAKDKNPKQNISEFSRNVLQSYIDIGQDDGR